MRAATIVTAMALWIPLLANALEADPPATRAEGLAVHHVGVINNRGVGAPALRVGNPEWDLMQRLYVVLAIADRIQAGMASAEERTHLDAIVSETVQEETEHGSYHFLLGYARSRTWRFEEGRSLFVDGEILMMLAVRRIVADARFDGELVRRMKRVADQLRAAPLCGESYPDECWTFCNTTALAALRIADASLGTDHRALVHRWLTGAKAKLIDSDTGLLASSYRYDGSVLDGPEGSSIWMSAHNLQLLDPAFARDQYDRAKRALAIHLGGFGFAREWPRGGGALMDIDSGPVIPLLEASAGSSGLALLGAASFGDDSYFAELSRSLSLGAFPVADGAALSFAAAGDMGNAVAFAAHTAGPLWREVAEQLKRTEGPK